MQRAEITPLHSNLGNKSEISVSKKKKKKKEKSNFRDQSGEHGETPLHYRKKRLGGEEIREGKADRAETKLRK